MSRVIENCNMIEEIESYQKSVTIGPKRRSVLNFSPGPAKLPEPVMHKAQLELREYEHTGISVLEMSHRSKEFVDILNKTEQLFRDLMSIPSSYSVLFLQGGGTGQFAAVPLNLMGLSQATEPVADYAVTGGWSKKAADEAAKYVNVNTLFTEQQTNGFTGIPDSLQYASDAAFLYYCANETVHGIEFPYVPESPYRDGSVPIVSDMSSNILSREVDVCKHGIIFAGTQKNIGAAGCTVVICRNDLMGHAHKFCPSVLNYQQQHKMQSIYNTPPCFSIYLTKLVLEWIRDQGGLSTISERNTIKSRLIYDVIDQSNGFYSCPVDVSCRSRMNVPFRIGSRQGLKSLETDFLEQAELRDMISLKGHRSVGGIRASLYNAVSVREAQQLADFMREFQEKHEANVENDGKRG